jgi:hypothetical protein
MMIERQIDSARSRQQRGARAIDVVARRRVENQAVVLIGHQRLLPAALAAHEYPAIRHGHLAEFEFDDALREQIIERRDERAHRAGGDPLREHFACQCADVVAERCDGVQAVGAADCR